MTCGSCGGQVPDGSKFCNHCGVPNQGRVYASPTDKLEKPGGRPNRARHSLIGLLVVLGAIFGSLAIYRVLTPSPKVPSPVAATSPATESSPAILSSEALTPAEFTIGPAGLRYFRVLIDEHTLAASIVGKVTAKGGAYDDIEVFVFGPDPSVNPRQGLYVKALYNSRRVSSQNLDVPVTPGEYYLVFSNAWSPSNKTVSANITIQAQPH
jgi:hypothetical protein